MIYCKNKGIELKIDSFWIFFQIAILLKKIITIALSFLLFPSLINIFPCIVHQSPVITNYVALAIEMNSSMSVNWVPTSPKRSDIFIFYQHIDKVPLIKWFYLQDKPLWN